MTPIKLQLGAHNIGSNYAPAPEPASERPVPVSSTVRNRVGCGPPRRAACRQCGSAGTCNHLAVDGVLALPAASTMSAGRDAYAGVSCTRMGYYTAGRRWQFLASTTCGIRLGGMPCRHTSTVARSAVRCSSTPNISLNMKPLIRIVRSAEARRFSTYPPHLSRKRPERAEIYLLTIRLFWYG
jgi:hypothetical protein